MAVSDNEIFCQNNKFYENGRNIRHKKVYPTRWCEHISVCICVTDHTIDSIFFMIGQSEKMIRTNPAHQTTAELRKVFVKIMP